MWIFHEKNEFPKAVVGESLFFGAPESSSSSSQGWFPGSSSSLDRERTNHPWCLWATPRGPSLAENQCKDRKRTPIGSARYCRRLITPTPPPIWTVITHGVLSIHRLHYALSPQISRLHLPSRGHRFGDEPRSQIGASDLILTGF